VAQKTHHNHTALNTGWHRKCIIITQHSPEDFLFFGIWISTGTSGLKNSWTWFCQHK